MLVSDGAKLGAVAIELEDGLVSFALPGHRRRSGHHPEQRCPALRPGAGALRAGRCKRTPQRPVHTDGREDQTEDIANRLLARGCDAGLVTQIKPILRTGFGPVRNSPSSKRRRRRAHGARPRAKPTARRRPRIGPPTCRRSNMPSWSAPARSWRRWMPAWKRPRSRWARSRSGRRPTPQRATTSPRARPGLPACPSCSAIGVRPGGTRQGGGACRVTGSPRRHRPSRGAGPRPGPLPGRRLQHRGHQLQAARRAGRTDPQGLRGI